MMEQERVRLNAERLLLLDACLHRQVAAVLSDLEAQGLRPLIAKDVFRTPARQLELYRQGRSKVRWGFHNATTRDGQPGALAADIVDADLAWNARRDFWLRLGEAALRRGLNWGGMFGLSAAQKTALRIALEARNYSVKLALGWDVAHIQIAGITIAEARAGKRPEC